MIAGCSDSEPSNLDPVANGQEQALKSVKVSKIISQKIGDPLERAADVQSSVQFEILSKAGGDIEQVLKKRGDLVHEGEIIIRMNSNEARFQKEAAEFAVKNAQEGIVKAKAQAQKVLNNQKLELKNSIQKMEQGLTELTRNYNKMRNDYDVGLATKAQLHQTEVQLLSTRTDLEQMKQKLNTLEPTFSVTELETQLITAQAMLQQVEQAMTYLEVKAPVSGILSEMPFEVGMILKQGDKVGLIQRIDPIKIKAMLTELEIKYLVGKTELTYYLPDTKQKYKGKIGYLSKIADPESKAYEINLEVPNKELALKPGMKVWIQLTEEQDQIVATLPTYSVVKDGTDDYVFVLTDGIVEKRRVQLGRVNEPNQEVLSGVKEGELVVISTPNQLRDKEKVRQAAAE
ncbi:Cation efflux system protein CusB precursor [compost metagenome]